MPSPRISTPAALTSYLCLCPNGTFSVRPSLTRSFKPAPPLPPQGHPSLLRAPFAPHISHHLSFCLTCFSVHFVSHNYTVQEDRELSVSFSAIFPVPRTAPRTEWVLTLDLLSKCKKSIRRNKYSSRGQSLGLACGPLPVPGQYGHHVLPAASGRVRCTPGIQVQTKAAQ